MKWIARIKLKMAISYHKRVRANIIYERGTPGEDISWNSFVENQDDLWHKAACEYRCIERIKKLLNEYQ